MRTEFVSPHLLPQELSMQSFAFAPPNLGVGDNKKSESDKPFGLDDANERQTMFSWTNTIDTSDLKVHPSTYVSVLLPANENDGIVMKACEGCRRRKIKCDAATTNTWPCAACVRLKSQCVPPSLNYDRVPGGGGAYTGLEGVLDFDHSSASGDDEHYNQHGEATHLYDFVNHNDSLQNPQLAYGHGLTNFSTPPNTGRDLNQPDFNYDVVTSLPMTFPETYQNPTAFQAANAASPPPLLREDSNWSADQRTAAELSDVLGELSIKENGVGMPEFPLSGT